MEQMMTYKRNKPLTKQSLKNRVLSLILSPIRDVGRSGREGESIVWLCHIIIRWLCNYICLMTSTWVNSGALSISAMLFLCLSSVIVLHKAGICIPEVVLLPAQVLHPKCWRCDILRATFINLVCLWLSYL